MQVGYYCYYYKTCNAFEVLLKYRPSVVHESQAVRDYVGLLEWPDGSTFCCLDGAFRDIHYERGSRSY